jgi:preprotein translocase subunit SecA
MLKHGQDPRNAFANEHWVDVLAQKWRETEENKKLVQSLGGLYVLGTERHEARRIDNQLRGRSGRLGDPGRSRFYLSMDDDLMRRFGGERMSALMGRLGMEDDMPIEAGVVSKAIENAQSKVEGYNFDTRKHVLQYDEVVNEQRNRIYEQRRRILTEPSLQQSIIDMIGQEINALVANFTAGDYEDEWQLDDLVQALRGVFPLSHDFSAKQWHGQSREQIEESATQKAIDAYAEKEQMIGEAVMRQAEKQIMLYAVDSRWVHHLTDLDRLREGIGLRAYGQQDPLVSYKREAFDMYVALLEDIRSDIVKGIFAFQLQRNAPVATPAQRVAARAGQNGEDAGSQPQSTASLLRSQPIARNVRTNRESAAAQTVRKSGPQIGRNDLCWCGSGKKYKNCHMESDKQKSAAR